MESERASPTQSETMWSTNTGPYWIGKGYVRKDNKLGMVQQDYKLGYSLNGVATHECFPDTMSEITKVKSATKINQVGSGTITNYYEVVSNKVDDDDV